MEIKKDYYPEELAEALYKAAGRHEDEHKPGAVDALYDLMACAENEYNRDSFRDLWELLQDVAEDQERRRYSVVIDVAGGRCKMFIVTRPPSWKCSTRTRKNITRTPRKSSQPARPCIKKFGKRGRGNETVEKVLEVDHRRRGRTSYTVVESDMPLDYEHCCGYFLNEELTKTIKNDVVDLSNGDVNVYTRTADSSLFTFTTDGADGYIITKNSSVSYSGTEFNLVMPREYENKTVTTIADSAFFGVFENCDLINVVFSSEIKTIAKKCFDADEGDSPCVINELNIHDNIETIDDYAFAYCEGIGQLILPDSLKTIGIHAFRVCTGLTGNLILPNSITKINAPLGSLFTGIKKYSSLIHIAYYISSSE